MSKLTYRKILDAGKNDTCMNLVLLSEGYLPGEMRTFRKKADELTGVMQSEPWWTPDILNVHTLEVPSRKPATYLRPGQGALDTAFKARYGGPGKSDRILSGDGQHVRQVVRDTFGQVPLTIGILVNSSLYGGLGTTVQNISYFWTFTGNLWTNVALHEFGHAFAGLCDEYAGNNTKRYTGNEPSCPNVSKDGKKWNDITDSKYEGAGHYAFGLYRPSRNCRMRTIHTGFCAVCSNAISEKLETFRKDSPMVHRPKTARATSATRTTSVTSYVTTSLTTPAPTPSEMRLKTTARTTSVTSTLTTTRPVAQLFIEVRWPDGRLVNYTNSRQGRLSLIREAADF